MKAQNLQVGIIIIISNGGPIRGTGLPYLPAVYHLRLLLLNPLVTSHDHHMNNELLHCLYFPFI